MNEAQNSLQELSKLYVRIDHLQNLMVSYNDLPSCLDANSYAILGTSKLHYGTIRVLRLHVARTVHVCQHPANNFVKVCIM